MGWLRLSVLLLLQVAVWTADDSVLQRPVTMPDASGTPSASAPPEVGGALGTAIGLAIALGGIGMGLLWWARHKGWVASPGGRARGHLLQLRDTLPLGMKRSVALVQYGEHAVLVGVSEQGLCHLATLPAADLPPPDTEPSHDLPDTAALEPPPPPQPGTATFRAKLRALTKGAH